MRRNQTDPVFDWLAYYAEFDPGRLAAVDLATQRWLTYGQFNERATRLATALRERFGVEHGDRVAFLARNGTDHFEAMFACWKLGAIFVPMNWRLSPHETAAILEHCEPRVVLHDADFAPLLAVAHAPTLERVPGHAACGYEQLIAAHEPRVAMEHADFDTINMLLYTSGTTGRPKGVIYTHRMTNNIVVHAALHARIRAGTRTLTYSPLFHAAGLNALAMPSFHYGGAVLVMRTFDAGECLAMLTDPGPAGHAHGRRAGDVPADEPATGIRHRIVSDARGRRRRRGAGAAAPARDLGRQGSRAVAIVRHDRGVQRLVHAAREGPRADRLRGSPADAREGADRRRARPRAASQSRR